MDWSLGPLRIACGYDTLQERLNSFYTCSVEEGTKHFRTTSRASEYANLRKAREEESINGGVERWGKGKAIQGAGKGGGQWMDKDRVNGDIMQGKMDETGVGTAQ